MFNNLKELFLQNSEFKIKLLDFIINKTFGNLFKNVKNEDILQELSNGSLILKDLELNPDHINSLLQDFPFNFTHGHVKELKVQIPFDNLLNGKISIDSNLVLLKFSLKGKKNKY